MTNIALYAPEGASPANIKPYVLKVLTAMVLVHRVCVCVQCFWMPIFS